MFMRYIPPHIGKNATFISSICYAVAAVLFISSQLKLFSAALMQLLAVLSLVVGVYITTRYQLAEFAYIIRDRSLNSYDDDDTAAAVAGVSSPIISSTLDFVVERLQGSRHWAVCRLALSDAVSLVKQADVDAEYDRLGGKSNMKIYNYCVNIKPPTSYVIIFSDSENDSTKPTYSSIIFEPSESMLNYINKVLMKSSGEF